MSYSEKLKNPRWQKKRLEILVRDEFTCQHCLSIDKNLNIHHIAYFKKMPWDIDNFLLITLCDDCHSIEQEKIKESHFDLVTIFKQNGFMSIDFENTINKVLELGKIEFFNRINKNE